MNDQYPTINTDDIIYIEELIDSLDTAGDDRKADIEKLLSNLTGGGDVQYKGEWYPYELIHEDHFSGYVKGLVSECYDLRDVPNFIHIDWDATADECRIDYTDIQINGETYYYR